MAIELTPKTQALINQTKVEPIIVVVIEGFTQIFATEPLQRAWRFDDGESFDTGLFFDGTVPQENVVDAISLENSTRKQSQQIEIDRGGSGSTGVWNINFVDKDGTLSNLFAPGVVVPDILGLEAKVSVIPKGAVYPDDEVIVFSGIIKRQKSSPGSIEIGIEAPEGIKDQELFTVFQKELTAAIDDVVDVIPVTDTQNILPTQDALTTYLRIEDEVIAFTGTTANSFTGCLRGQFGTIAASHDAETEVSPYYILTGQPLDIALKLMLSNIGNTPWLENVSIANFNNIDPGNFIQDAFLVQDPRLIVNEGILCDAFISFQ